MRRLAPFAVVFGIALAFRLAYVLDLQGTPTFESPLVDAFTYDQSARQIAEHGPGALTRPYYQPPLYPMLLGLTYRLTGGSYLAPRILQAILGALTTWMVFVLARRAGGSWGPWVSAALFAFYGVAVYFDGELLPTSLVLFCNTAAIALLLKARDVNRRVPWLVAAGLVLGISSAARPTALLLAGLALFWWWRRERGTPSELVLFVVAAVIPILPFTAANQAAGERVLLSYNGGINFYVGNGAHSDSLTSIQPGYAWDRMQLEPHRAGTRSRAEESRYWFNRGIEEAAGAPGDWLASLSRKVVRLLDARETPRNLDYEYWRRDSRILAFPWITFGWVLPLAIVGLWLSPINRSTRWLLVGALLVTAAQNLGFFVAGRYRVEAAPLLCLLAGLGVSAWVDASRQRKLATGILVLVAAAFVHVDFLEERDVNALRSNLNRGLALDRAGLDATAERWYQKALQADPTHPDVRRLLGDLALSRKDYELAAEHYEVGLERAPEYVMTLLGQAQAFEGLGRTTEAESRYKRALDQDPWSVETHLNYGVFLGKSGRLEEARQILTRGAALSPDPRKFQKNLENVARMEAEARPSSK